MNCLKYIQKNIIKILPALILSFLFWANYSLAEYKVEMALPGAPTTISDPGQYIKYLFNFGFYLIAFLAVAMITYGGILYMIPSKMAEAKERIWGAVIGVVFLLCSFLILQTIDPNLLNLTPKTPAEVNTLKADALKVITPALYGIRTSGNWLIADFTFDNSSANPYNTREKCETVGRRTFGERYYDVLFDETKKNCSIMYKKQGAGDAPDNGTNKTSN